MKKNIYFIDIEASSLSWDSYPIEISWGTNFDDIKNFLISPEFIPEWNDWDDNAQKIHGIKRNELIKNGENPFTVCNEIINELSNQDVYSDNPCHDAMWLYNLFKSCKVDAPPINVLNIDSLLIQLVCPNKKDRIKGLLNILELKSMARGIVNGRHRADIDVNYLIQLTTLAKQMEFQV